MIDFVCVEFSIRIHVVRVLIECRMMQISSGSFQRFRSVRQISEHHRRAQHVNRIIFPTEARIKQSRNNVRTLEIQIIPHALAQQRIRILPPLEVRSVTEEPCKNRTDHRTQTQLGNRILFRNIVDADLRRSRAAHHARTKLADTTQIRGHRLVTVLRIHRNVGIAGLRLVSVINQAEAKLVKHRIDFAAERSVNRAQILRLMQNTQRTFQLATRLKRHGNTFAPKPNKPAVLPVFLAFVVIRANAVQQRLDAVLLVIVHGGIIAVMHRQMLDFHAETAGSALLAA